MILSWFCDCSQTIIRFCLPLLYISPPPGELPVCFSVGDKYKQRELYILALAFPASFFSGGICLGTVLFLE